MSGRERRVGRPRPSEDGEAPLALIDATGALGLTIYACNKAALSEGVREGEPLADVRARLPGLVTRPADPSGDAVALDRLAQWCERYGPAVNTQGPRGLWIDTTGVAHLFGGEMQLLADLQRRLAAFGLTARLGLAPTLSAARAIACFLPNSRLHDRIATIGDVAQTLSALPVEALQLDAAPLLLLRRLGLRRIGQLDALPRAALKRRFPSREAAYAVLQRLDRILGRAPEPLVPRRQPPRHAVRRAFGEPLISREGLDAALADALSELCGIFSAHGIGARRLTLTLYRSDGTQVEQSLGFSAPTNRPAHILRLLADRLERLEEQSPTSPDGAEPLLGLGIDMLVLAAGRTQDQPPVQAGMLGRTAAPAAWFPEHAHPTGPEVSASVAPDGAAPVAALVDRLVNRLGPHHVQRLVPFASHIPERAQRKLTALVAQTQDGPGMLVAQRQRAIPPRLAPLTFVRRLGPLRPLLLLTPPAPITVTAEIPEGPPARFTWRRLTRRIVLAEGPERIAPEWWREIAAGASQDGRDGDMAVVCRSRTRDYYRIEDDSGCRYWVFRDGLYQDRGESDDDPPALPRWYVHGLYA